MRCGSVVEDTPDRPPTRGINDCMVLNLSRLGVSHTYPPFQYAAPREIRDGPTSERTRSTESPY